MHMIDLTLIDLPGIARVAVGNQPQDIGRQVSLSGTWEWADVGEVSASSPRAQVPLPSPHFEWLGRRPAGLSRAGVSYSGSERGLAGHGNKRN